MPESTLRFPAHDLIGSIRECMDHVVFGEAHLLGGQGLASHCNKVRLSFGKDARIPTLTKHRSYRRDAGSRRPRS